MSNTEAPPPPAKLQRDDWMTMPLGASDRSLSLLAERRSGAEQEQLKQKEKKEEVSIPLTSIFCCHHIFFDVHYQAISIHT